MATLAVVVGLGWAPFDDPGEGMHAEIARELADARDPFDLRLNGVRYLDKPPLLYWLVASAFRVLGPGEAAARTVPALAGLAAIAGVVWLGWRLLAPAGAIAAGLILLTTLLFFVHGRYVRPETLLAAALSWGFGLLLVGIVADRRGLATAGLAAFGMAGLAKDVLGAMAPVVVVGAVMAATGRFRPVGRWLPLPGVILGLSLAAGWYALVELRTPGFIWYTLVDNHLFNLAGMRRFPDEDVPLGALEFLVVAMLGAAPWIVAAAFTVTDLVRRRAWRRPEELSWVILGVWVLAVLTTAAASKFRLPHYGVPAYPAMALLAARAWTRQPGRGLMLAHAACLALLAAGLWIELARGGSDFVGAVMERMDAYTRKERVIGAPSPVPPWTSYRPLVLAAAVACSLGAAGVVAASWRGAGGAALGVTLLAMGGVLPAAAAALGLTAEHRAVRHMASEIRREARPGDRLLHEGPIEKSGALELYSGVRPIIVEGRRSVLAFGATFDDARESFWDADRLAREWTGPRRLLLLATRIHPPGVIARLPPDRLRLLAEMNGRRLYVNEPP